MNRNASQYGCEIAHALLKEGDGLAEFSRPDLAIFCLHFAWLEEIPSSLSPEYTAKGFGCQLEKYFLLAVVLMLAATLANRPPIATDRFRTHPAAAINEIVEILAGQLDWLVVLFALVQILLVRLFAGHPANLALVCV
jgi:hypothetical protein